MSESVMARWQGFVQKVTERFSAILDESNAGFEELLSDPELDPITFTNAMNAIEIRCKDLGLKLSDTYSNQVALQLGAGGGMAEQLLRQTEQHLFETFTRFRAAWNGRLVRQLWTRVQPMLQRPVSCRSCGAELPRSVRHRAETVTCPHCQAVNSVSPEPLVYTYFSMAPDLAAEEQTVESKLAVERALDQGVAFEQIELRCRAHWQSYVQVRSAVLPMAADEQQRFVESRIEMLRKTGSF